MYDCSAFPCLGPLFHHISLYLYTAFDSLSSQKVPIGYFKMYVIVMLGVLRAGGGRGGWNTFNRADFLLSSNFGQRSEVFL